MSFVHDAERPAAAIAAAVGTPVQQSVGLGPLLR
jgi:hypothetical protein